MGGKSPTPIPWVSVRMANDTQKRARGRVRARVRERK